HVLLGFAGTVVDHETHPGRCPPVIRELLGGKVPFVPADPVPREEPAADRHPPLRGLEVRGRGLDRRGPTVGLVHEHRHDAARDRRVQGPSWLHPEWSPFGPLCVEAYAAASGLATAVRPNPNALRLAPWPCYRSSHTRRGGEVRSETGAVPQL